MKMVKCLQNNPSEKWLRELGLLSLGEIQRQPYHSLCNYLQGACNEVEVGLS